MAIAKLTHRPRQVGMLCAVVAVVLGLTYMTMAGAPLRYLIVNVAALGIGFLLFALALPLAPASTRARAIANLALGAALLLTSLVGTSVEGATRWLSLGGLMVQPSLIVLPLLAVNFGHISDPLSTLGLVIAAAALAIQPDRAMAGALAASMLALLLWKRDRHSIVAVAASLVAFFVAMVRPDTQGAMPYVDQIFYNAFGVSSFAGLAIIAGAAFLPMPGLVGYRHREAAAFAVFAVVWLAIVIAALLGNYPTPLVGYGGSAIIGYLLSLAALPPSDGADHLSNHHASA